METEVNNYENDSQGGLVPDSRPRPQADSIERALAEFGDRWTFLVMREAFYGVTRFDEFARNTGASPAILSDRLRKLVKFDHLTRVTYSRHANRYDYHLTEKGRDLYPMLVALMQWGDKWLSDETGAPLTLIHDCGTEGPFPLTCPGCRHPIDARTTTWRANDAV
jgi:DNA-binding HxlR family transcriptional regulator